jgi:hypothetical protein
MTAIAAATILAILGLPSLTDSSFEQRLQKVGHYCGGTGRHVVVKAGEMLCK